MCKNQRETKITKQEKEEKMTHIDFDSLITISVTCAIMKIEAK